MIRRLRWQCYDRGGCRIFFRSGCTTKKWRNWLVTGRKQILIANTKKKAGHLRVGEGGAHPLHPPPTSAPVMTKFIVDNRADALQTGINLFFYENKLSNCPRSLADASHEFQIHVSVRILTIKISQWARVNFGSYRKNSYRVPFVCETVIFCC